MKRTLILVIACACGLMLLALSVFTVTAGESVVVTQFGKPVATVTEPGLRWKLPGFLHRVHRFDARIEVFNTRPIQLLLGDKNPIIITTYVAWRIDDPLLYLRSLTLRETAREKLSDMVVSALGTALADYTLDDVINAEPDKVRITEIERLVLDRASAQAKDKYGINLVRLGMRRLSYPSIVAEAVYNRMRAEREKEARKFRAEGTEAADKIEATTDKEASQIKAEAYKEAEIVKGEGDREATRVYAQAYTQDPDLYDFLKSLELYRKTFKPGTTLVLSSDSELFRYLHSPEGRP
ncbi:MAG: protease modulator HflC [Thermoanaerobaculales bacterium]|nr:protease modulator HflC [Thermoanaerobaculales bacterium]